MPIDTYAEICKRECEWCSNLLHVFRNDDRVRIHRTSIFSTALCTAPTREQVIERLATELAEANKKLAAMREAVETAPHYAYCSVRYSGPHGRLKVDSDSVCNCWKSHALVAPNTPKES